MNWRRRNIGVRVVLIAATVLAAPAEAWSADVPANPIDPARVLNAIAKGVEFLQREQSPRGLWNDMPAFEGGVTALCALALLNAGVSPDEPGLAKTLDYLRNETFSKTYVVSLQTMVLCAGEPKRDLPTIQRNVQQLEEWQLEQGDRLGGWAYPDAAPDNSNSQFATLALYEAQQVGATVQRETWERTLAYWKRGQNVDGSWGYYPRSPGTGSMTCAGIGAVAMAEDALSSGDARVVNGKVQCCVPQEPSAELERGLRWMGTNFSVQRNPAVRGSDKRYLYYYLYGIERVGRLSARRFLGEHDWYREGTEHLVNLQDHLSHHWPSIDGSETRPEVNTALALLFLSKGRRPILLGKLKYGAGEGWNNHRRDAAHLTRHAEQAWGLPMIWQSIEVSAVSVDDLLQAPVIYISGSQAPDLVTHAQKLREYVDRGGFLFAEGCCGNQAAFRHGFEKLIAKMFPEPEYRLQQVGPAHPVWRMDELVRPDSAYFGRLWSVEYGCRTCVMLCDEDLSCYWELNKPSLTSTYPEAVRDRIDDAAAVGLNVLAYATNREPRGKEQLFAEAPEEESLEHLGRRGVLQVAKIRHGGGCNDAPGALVNLLRTAAQGETKLAVATKQVMVGAGDEALTSFPLAFMHGRHEFRFTPAERTQLRQYLERGGTLLADSICASSEFTTAFRRELQLVLPNAGLRQLPGDDPLFTTDFGGYDVRTVEVRDPQPAANNQPLAARVRRTPPQLEGIELDGRWAVLFSPLDLSCALERHEAIQCRGYSRQDAARIGVNVIQYVVNQ